jgi:7,8-dihydropterin-6-yl-methyl-4-(beta-D-ribofuranosyl)aminobenzene 5'-phosphate synthase
VLFDTGPDGRLIANASALGIDLSKVSQIVLSHGHYDHSGGLTALAAWYTERGLRPQLIAHPAVFNQRSVRLGWGPCACTLRQLGAPISQQQASQAFDLQLSTQPLPIGTSGLVFLGEIPRTLEFERIATLGSTRHPHGFSPDKIPDDSGLAWQSRDGLVIISGCAHSGICNLVEHARLTCHQPKVAAVLGGFHLRSAGPLHLLRVRRYFNALKIQQLSACHCSGWGRWWLPEQQDIATGSRLEFQHAESED